MAFGPITSWQIDGETVETVADFILGGSKITTDGDCSHEIKRHLLLGRKIMTNLDSILKAETLLANKGLSSQFSSVQFSRSVMSDYLQSMTRSKPGLPVHHQLPESTQTHVHRIGDAIQPSHPL